jgi:hypothetical protein
VRATAAMCDHLLYIYIYIDALWNVISERDGQERDTVQARRFSVANGNKLYCLIG